MGPQLEPRVLAHSLLGELTHINYLNGINFLEEINSLNCGHNFFGVVAILWISLNTCHMELNSYTFILILIL